MKKALRHLLRPPLPLLLLLCAVSVVLLTVVLQPERPADALAYVAYLLSAYALTVACIRIPQAIRTLRQLLSSQITGFSTGNRQVDRLLVTLGDYEARTQLILNASLVINLGYALLKLFSGFRYRSLWMAALGVYYAVLAFMRFLLLRSLHRGDGSAAYRRTAWLLNLLTVAMSGIFALTILEARTYSYPGILIYAMAVYAFARIITAVSNLLRRRRDENRALAAARCLSFAGALTSILALQTAMIQQFGDGQSLFAHRMNGIAGAVIVALMITLSAYMIARSTKPEADAAAPIPQQKEEEP